ncbi:MAG: addiction module protein [Ignavibacteriaceae bacterium]|nr:addiction module protein [Ignavibacteriaceae bacterium]
MDLKSIESELLKLTPRERAIVTYKLLNSLENEESADVEDIWLAEALSRYDQIYKAGKFTIDSELIIREAKSKYK